MSFDPDDRHYAIYQAGNDLIAVKLAGWLDGSAVCLPRSGARLVPAESGAGFLGLWRHRRSNRVRYTRELLALRPALADEMKLERDPAVELRKRFPQLKRGGRLRFRDFVPEVES